MTVEEKIMSYPNQKKIIVKKESCDRYLFAIVSQRALQIAMTKLTTMGSMKLWLYLAKNQNDYKFDLSFADCANFGLKSDAYHAAVKDLIDKGFLQLQHGNTYVFKDVGAYG